VRNSIITIIIIIIKRRRRRRRGRRRNKKLSTLSSPSPKLGSGFISQLAAALSHT